MVEQKDKYHKIYCDRDKYTNAILNSASNKKVVVAGPGTGKTYLFKEILKDKKNALTLTFINSLVEDLSLELYGLSEVRTLHSYARSILNKITKKNIKVWPRFSSIIKKDAVIFIGKEIDFNKLFYNREDTNDLIEFYKKRKEYYGYYGYTDIIFAAVMYFQEHKERIPSYDQILIDEFQDFNKLEVSLIELLAEKSPILLVGDDDQALYDFKDASTHFIREKHSSKIPDYESYTLPYCARCTKVVVSATNDIIRSAKNAGYLKNRIDKPYLYFQCQEKDTISDTFSKIGYAQLHERQIPWFIEKETGEVAKQIKDKFSVLIISPYKKQSCKIAEALKSKGLQNVEYSEKDDSEISLLDGLKLLLDDKEDNLGWRIIAENLLTDNEFELLLKMTETYPDKKIHGIIDISYKKEVKQMLRFLKYVKDNKPVDYEDFDKVLSSIKINPYQITIQSVKNEIDTTKQKIGNPAIRNLPIKLTTIQSSKGLSGDLIFITHFDDRYFIKNKNKSKISDQDICNFLVSLTRTKKKAYLISSVKEKPIFFKWISEDLIESLNSTLRRGSGPCGKKYEKQ